MTKIGAWWNLSAIRRVLLRDDTKIDRYNADVDRHNAEIDRHNRAAGE